MASIEIESALTLDEATARLRAMLGVRYPPAGGQTLKGSVRDKAIDLQLSGPTVVSGVPVYHTHEMHLVGRLVEGHQGVRFEGAFRRPRTAIVVLVFLCSGVALFLWAGLETVLGDVRRGEFDGRWFLGMVVIPLSIAVVLAVVEWIGGRLAAIDEALMLRALREVLGSEQTS